MISLVVGMMLLFGQGQGPARVPNGEVTGRVGSVDGTPMEGLRVAAMTVDGSERLLSNLASTDAAGNYRLAEIPPGRYYIVAGRLDSPTYFPGVQTSTGARIVTVADGAIAGVDFNLRRLPTVSGRVVGLAAPLAPGALSVRLQQNAGQLAGHVPVAADGRFEFRDIPNGDYTLTLDSARVTVMIRVDGLDVRGIEFAGPPLMYGRFEVEGGTPVPAPMDPSSLGLFRVVARFVDSIRTGGSCCYSWAGPDGSFMQALQPGNYWVDVDQMALGYAVKSIAHGNVDLLKEPLKIGVQPGLHEVRVTLAPTSSGVKVSGIIPGADAGAAMPRSVRIGQAMIRTGSSQNRQPDSAQDWDDVLAWITGEAPVGKDGSFEFLHVPAGRATIQTVPEIPGIFPATITVGDSDLNGVQLRRVPTEPAESLSDVQLENLPLVGVDPIQLIQTLPGFRAQPISRFRDSFGSFESSGSCKDCSAPVEGRLTGGAPFPKSIRLVRVPGLAASSAEGKTEFESPVDAQGRFAFREIPQGAYDVQLPLPGLVPTRLPRLSVMTQLPLVDLRNIEIPVPTRTTVNGRVLAGNGVSLQGLKDFRVTVEGASGVPIQNDGAFSLLLPQGEYMLALMNLPERYVVKSITYGPANLVQGPLMVDGPATAEIQITVAPRK